MPNRFPVLAATRALGVLVALLSFAGCTVTERQVAQQGGRIDDLQEKVLRLERALDEAALASTTPASDPQAARRLADLGQRVEELTDLSRDLVGRLAVVEQRGASPSTPPAPSPNLVSKIEELSVRVAALEARPATPTAPPSTTARPAPIPVAPPPAAPLKRSSQETYDTGYRQYKEGRFQEARETLRQYVDQYPDTPLTDNAVFWIGESFYDQAQYEQAILEYDKVVQKYPTGDKVSSALLKQAFAFDAIGDPVDARILLKKILREHPSSEQAAIAKRKLEILGE